MSLAVRKRWPAPSNRPPQVAEVVDFAVEDDPHRAVFVGQRLLAAGQVDDRQPPVSQGHAGRCRPTFGEVGAFAVRAAMAQHGRHPLERRASTALAGSVQTAPAMPHIKSVP